LKNVWKDLIIEYNHLLQFLTHTKNKFKLQSFDHMFINHKI